MREREGVEWIRFNESKLKGVEEDGREGTRYAQYIDYILAVCPGKLTAHQANVDMQ